MIGPSPESVTFGFFTKGTFHLHAPFSSASICPCSIHSRTSFPGPLSVRRCRSRELFVSRFRYYYVLRLLHQRRFPLRFAYRVAYPALGRDCCRSPGVTHESSVSCRQQTPWCDG